MRTFFTLLLCGTFLMSYAQNKPASTPKKASSQPKTLKVITTLQMPGQTGTNGTRGASVVWNPITLKYYASMAGNSSYPMAVFDPKGKLLSDPELSTDFDTRGLWYDASTKRICANGYDDNGWIAYVLDTKGIPLETKRVISGKTQPDENSVGVSDGKKAVYFMNPSFDAMRFVVSEYSLQGSFVKDYYLILPDPLLEYDESIFNMNCILFTGIPGKEFGVINPEDNQIHLFSKTSGKWVQTLNVPLEVELSENFNSAYANGLYWFFNQNNRTWYGMK